MGSIKDHNTATTIVDPGSIWPGRYFLTNDFELSSQTFRQGCLDMCASSVSAELASVRECPAKLMCFESTSARCVAVFALIAAPGGSIKQALVTPEISANIQADSIAYALVLLVQLTKKFVILMQIRSSNFIGTRLKGFDADQTMVNWKYANLRRHCPAFGASRMFSTVCETHTRRTRACPIFSSACLALPSSCQRHHAWPKICQTLLFLFSGHG